MAKFANTKGLSKQEKFMIQGTIIEDNSIEDIANAFNVLYQTTLLIFKDGKEVYRSIGETTEDLIYEALKASI